MIPFFNPKESLSCLLEKRRVAQSCGLGGNQEYTNALGVAQATASDELHTFVAASLGVINSSEFKQALDEAIEHGLHVEFVQAFAGNVAAVVEGFPKEASVGSIERAAIQSNLMGKESFRSVLEILKPEALSDDLSAFVGGGHEPQQLPDAKARSEAFVQKTSKGLARAINKKNELIVESFAKAQNLSALVTHATRGSLTKDQVSLLKDEGGLAHKRTVSPHQRSDLFRATLCLMLVSQEGLKIDRTTKPAPPASF